MGNDAICSECGAGNVPVAHFCSQCGHPLKASRGSVGRVSHPAPAAAPEGYMPCGGASDLYYRCGSAWGGPRLLATENLGVSIFNAGYGLNDVELRTVGVDDSGQTLFSFRQKLARLARRSEVSFEVPSYELPDAVFRVIVELVSAEYDR